ncbi:CBU_1752 family Dot/Icm T4SS effector [Coxiella burnetii]|uniref:CBU_1752 family Dot/Icm T4SS effector n=1 Tax=Coxiella burnetii TaxID=777 RepID=UPI0003A63FD7|nr:CBU_1752 family Dot/Icm T4SS effector [Coxiella burnetii]
MRDPDQEMQEIKPEEIFAKISSKIKKTDNLTEVEEVWKEVAKAPLAAQINVLIFQNKKLFGIESTNGAAVSDEDAFNIQDLIIDRYTQLSINSCSDITILQSLSSVTKIDDLFIHIRQQGLCPSRETFKKFTGNAHQNLRKILATQYCKIAVHQLSEITIRQASEGMLQSLVNSADVSQARRDLANLINIDENRFNTCIDEARFNYLREMAHKKLTTLKIHQNWRLRAKGDPNLSNNLSKIEIETVFSGGKITKTEFLEILKECRPFIDPDMKETDLSEKNITQSSDNTFKYTFSNGIILSRETIIDENRPPNEDGSEEVKFSLTIPKADKDKKPISIDHYTVYRGFAEALKKDFEIKGRNEKEAVISFLAIKPPDKRKLCEKAFVDAGFRLAISADEEASVTLSVPAFGPS